MLQKLKFAILGLIFTAGMVVPFTATPTAFAANKPKANGTCVISTEITSQVGQTTHPNTVASCKSLMPSGKDANGKKYSTTTCSELTETNGALVIVDTLDCSNQIFFKDGKIVLCKDGVTVALHNDVKNCTSTEDQTCGTATTAACPNSDVTDPASQGGACADISACDLVSKYIQPLINFLSALIGVAVVISIVIGGIQYGSSAGDPQSVNAAKNRIRNAIIALITFIFLYTLLNFLIPGGLL